MWRSSMAICWGEPYCRANTNACSYFLVGGQGRVQLALVHQQQGQVALGHGLVQQPLRLQVNEQVSGQRKGLAAHRSASVMASSIVS